jgi:hypothetical protein
MPALILSLIMCGVAYSILFLNLPILVTLIVQIVVGIAVYAGLAWLLGLESLTYIMETVRGYLPERAGVY